MIRNFKLALQYVLPHHLLTAVVGALARSQFRPWSSLLIRAFRRAYGVDLSEAATSDISRYPSFNAFFTRPLRAGARAWPRDADAVCSPVDGTVSAFGRVEDGEVLQIKGMSYALDELLGDGRAATRYDGGAFITLYLAPRDYHRVHMPVDGELAETRHIPGRLFSVAPFTVAGIPRLFCRNERLACHFATPAGAMAQVLVGAMLVAGIETVWQGAIGHPRQAATSRFGGGQVRLARGEEMGRFAMGSTVILVFEPGAVRWRNGLLPGDPVRLGQTLGTITQARTAASES